jgi:hypothetical protein
MKGKQTKNLGLNVTKFCRINISPKPKIFLAMNIFPCVRIAYRFEKWKCKLASSSIPFIIVEIVLCVYDM